MIQIYNKILWLLSQPNVLGYDFNTLKNKYHYDNILEEVGTELEAEMWMIGSELCGTSGRNLAIEFMKGYPNEESFLHNVSFNGERSNPLILRAINIRVMNTYPEAPEYEPYLEK